MCFQLTGATGFVGGHVTSQLLQAGHNIRAIVRPGRSERLLSTFPDAGERLEIFELALLHKDNFTDALKNIEAVIHVASPIGSKGDSELSISADRSHYSSAVPRIIRRNQKRNV